MIKLLKKYAEVIKYLIIGVLTTVLNMIFFYALTYFLLDGNDAMQLQIANIISWIGSVTFAYITNRKIVFNSTNGVFKESAKFYSSRLLTLFLDMGIMFLFVTCWSFNYKIIKVISNILVIIGNYVISKLIVFRK